MRTKKMTWNLSVALAWTTQCHGLASLQTPSAPASSWCASAPITTPPSTQSRHAHQLSPISQLSHSSKQYSTPKDARETGLYAYTDQLLPAVEYTHDFQPIPFSGHFLPIYISQANLIGTTFLHNIKDFQHQICDADGIQRSDQLTCFPPNIYFTK